MFEKLIWKCLKGEKNEFYLLANLNDFSAPTPLVDLTGWITLILANKLDLHLGGIVLPPVCLNMGHKLSLYVPLNNCDNQCV